MKTKLTTLTILFLLIFNGKNLYSQLTFDINVSGYEVVGNSISFDISLNTTGPDALYLGHADFIFTYNSANFTAPTFEFVDGSAELINSNGVATTAYDFGIAAGFTPEGNLAVNVNAPTPGNQTQFNNAVAKIESTPQKLGRFTLTGIINFEGTLGLQWKMSPPGVSCNVTNFLNVPPFSLSPVTGTGTFNPPFDAPLPVELASFTASIDRRDVYLNWSTASEINNSGFDVERANVKGETSNEWSKITFIEGNGTTSETKNYTFTDRGLNTGKYNYRLKQIDYNGNFEYFNLSNEVIIGVPDKYDLSQNYPNPFNPVTKINFDLPFDSKVTMKIFDITGREMATLVNDVQPAGYYTVTFDAKNIASGMYFYRIIAEGGNQQYVMTKKMLMVK